MALQLELEDQGNWLFKYRSILPLIVLFVGMAVHLHTELHPELSLFKGTIYDFYYDMFALLVGLAGLAIRIYTVGHTPKNTSGRNTKEGQVADTLNTTGIYSVVRHPLYLGNLLMWLGPAMLTGHLWFIIAFCLFYWVYYERIMYAEEQFLKRKFSEVYTAWSKNVPAFMPNFKNFKKSDLPFSWKKVLKKEKNGLFALFLIFAIFDISGEAIKGQSDYNYFLIGATIVTGCAYFILKYMKNRTSLLNEPDR